MKTPYWTGVLKRGRERLKQGKVPFLPKHISLAHSWITCACGKQDPRIPRTDLGDPQDEELADLGSGFWNWVSSQNLTMAATNLSLIEIRAAQVLKEVEK